MGVTLKFHFTHNQNARRLAPRGFPVNLLGAESVEDDRHVEVDVRFVFNPQKSHKEVAPDQARGRIEVNSFAYLSVSAAILPTK